METEADYVLTHERCIRLKNGFLSTEREVRVCASERASDVRERETKSENVCVCVCVCVCVWIFSCVCLCGIDIAAAISWCACMFGFVTSNK